MRSDIQKMKSRGFTLVELLIVVAIIGILAGLAMLAMGRSSDSTEATAIMANLEAAKSALLAYSMEHRTRTTDPLEEFVGVTDMASLDKYMDASLKSGGRSAARHFRNLEVRRVAPPASPFQVGFNNITVTPGVKSSLQKKIDASGGEYILEGNSIWLRVR